MEKQKRRPEEEGGNFDPKEERRAGFAFLGQRMDRPSAAHMCERSAAAARRGLASRSTAWCHFLFYI